MTGDESAFPVEQEANVWANGSAYGHGEFKKLTYVGGITKRELAAMFAMQGILSALSLSEVAPSDKAIADRCVGMADALLKVLAKREE